jgi:Ca2+-dependent lipid-binding protein
MPPSVTDEGYLQVNIIAAYNLIDSDKIGGHSDTYSKVIY